MPDAAPTLDSPAAAAPGRPKQGEQHAQGPEFDRLPFPYRPEAEVVADSLAALPRQQSAFEQGPVRRTRSFFLFTRSTPASQDQRALQPGRPAGRLQ
jgi:hypothetical protein